MPIILGVAVVFGLAYATVYATNAAGRAVRDGYRRKVAAWQKTHPRHTAVAAGMAKVGKGLSAVAFGAPLVTKAAVAGWREGWPEGKRIAYARYAPVEQPQPEPQREAAPRTTEPEPVRPDTPTEQTPSNVRPISSARRKTTPTPAATPAAPVHETRSTDMAIETVTGGEITSPETLAAELQTIVEEAAADHDDAAADAKRADEDFTRIETMVGSLTNLKLPTDDIATVQALLEPAQQRKAAAEARQAAAEARLAGAQQALEMANRHVELQGQAAGEFYGN